MTSKDNSKDRRVWCPACKVEFEPDGTEGRAEFGPQCVKVSTEGAVDLGHPWDVFLDWWHMPCGTKVRATVNARWDEELGDYGPDDSPMFELDLPGGPLVITRVATTDESLPEGWTTSDEATLESLGKSLASMMDWWQDILETVK